MFGIGLTFVKTMVRQHREPATYAPLSRRWACAMSR